MNIPELFSSMVFDDAVMKERLPEATYAAIKCSVDTGEQLEAKDADIIAEAMKNWAIEKGATHYTHWFQPMTGITAEKHDSFIKPIGGGKVIMEFSGKALVHGESDASSFPSGGLRATFEARGYTAWDPTSYAFIKDGSLCIPTAFCSYSGDALDKKTPLLRSMQAINKQSLRILRLFGNTEVKKVTATIGAEQEYFLIDKDIFNKRTDLITCGRTLFGARPPKGQELDDHYSGAIKPRVSAFMKELDEELWKLGVPAKTKHNEAAPAQHELAPVFSSANTATDNNQIMMELMKSVAARHGMACLLHEKPFAAVNGSGKHVNWSLSTDTGVNLLEPGDTPYKNAQFLVFLLATIKAVDDYQDLLRVSVATAGNDFRLGQNEAPPAIISVFVGDDLAEILRALESDTVGFKGRKKTEMEIGVDVLPHFPKDTTDRNRTSPFAFTGNKFEFRMPGSSLSTAGPTIIINTIVADTLKEFADRLEKASDFKQELSSLIKSTLIEHKRIIFNGNNYSEEWVTEATERGLLNLKSTVDALPHYVDSKNIELFLRHGVFSTSEIHSRYEILLENYAKTVRIEALTMLDMARKQIIPAVVRYEKDLAETIVAKKSAGVYCDLLETTLLQKTSDLGGKIIASISGLEEVVNNVCNGTPLDIANYYSIKVIPVMNELRAFADSLEELTPADYRPFPTYSELLFSVN